MRNIGHLESLQHPGKESKSPVKIHKFNLTPFPCNEAIARGRKPNRKLTQISSEDDQETVMETLPRVEKPSRPPLERTTWEPDRTVKHLVARAIVAWET
jgi:hypothetical protein